MGNEEGDRRPTDHCDEDNRGQLRPPGNASSLAPFPDEWTKGRIREKPLVEARGGAREARGGYQKEGCRRQHREDRPQGSQTDEEEAGREQQPSGNTERRSDGRAIFVL